jgi:chromate transport protein ChrA
LTDLRERPEPAAPARARSIGHPSFAEALRFWVKLGFVSFGGPSGQIAIHARGAGREETLDWRGTLGALITTWVTFVSCFIWIFLGAPHVERLRGNVKLTGALSTITAAVVGVILNLAVWFGLHVLFPDGERVDAFAVLVLVAALLALVKWRWGIVPVVAGGAIAGLVYKVLVQP